MKELKDIIRPHCAEAIGEIAKFMKMSPLSITRWFYNSKASIPHTKVKPFLEWTQKTKILSNEQKQALTEMLTRLYHLKGGVK